MVDEELENAKPLPNLEFKFVCANSLVGVDLSLIYKNNQPSEALFGDADEKEAELLNNLEVAIKNYFEVDSKEKDFEKTSIDDIKRKVYKKLNSQERVKDKASIDQIEEIKKLIRWDQFCVSKPAPFFNSNWMFGLPKSFRGFDIVIGNPPYVDYRKIDKQTKSGIQNYHILQKDCSKQISLYSYFFEFAIKNKSPSGIISYITPYNYLGLDNYFCLRKLLIDNGLYKIIDLSHIEVFDHANTYTCISLLKKSISSRGYISIVKVDNKNVDIVVNSNPTLLLNIDEVNKDVEKIIYLDNDYQIVKKVKKLSFVKPLSEYAQTLCSLSKTV